MKTNKSEAFWYLFTGFVISGIGCSLYVYCGLGSDAFNVLTQGIARMLGTSVGNAFYLAEAVLLAVVAVAERRYIGIGSLLGIFLVGTMMNLWSFFLAPFLQAASLVVRLCCLLVASGCIGTGIALARKSGLGMTPNDILPMILHEKLGHFQFRTVRMTFDGIVLLTGLALGGTAGVGTVMNVLLIGPCIQLTSSFIEQWEKRHDNPDPARRLSPYGRNKIRL